MRAKRKAKKSRFMVFFLLIVIAAAMGYFAYKNLRVTEVALEGNASFSEQQVIELTGIDVSTHLFDVNPAEIFENLQKNPYLVAEEIKKQWWPPMLKIRIRERVIEGVIRRGDQQVCIDRSGIVLEVVPGLPLKANTEIIGLSVSGNALGKQLSVQEPYQFEALKMVLGVLSDMDDEGLFTAIDVTEPMEISLNTDSLITVRIGQGVDLEKKISLALDALRILYEKNYDRGILDVSNGIDAVYREPTSVPEMSADDDAEPPGDETPDTQTD